MTGSFSPPRNLKDRFHLLDFQIMKYAFDIHTRMGNSLDEETYQNELLHLIGRNGIQVQKEVLLPIEFGVFRKDYFIDLLIEDEHIYELKVLPGLTNQCRSQTINYQLIAEKPYGKLINFGASSVEHEFSTSTLTKAERKVFTTDLTDWDEALDPGRSFLNLVSELLTDWGTRLDPVLYSEALLAHLPEGIETRIEIISDGRPVGSKRVRLARQNIAFKLTTSKKPNPLKIQFQKFINHTNLNALLWVNLNQNKVTFCTLIKK
ncbi:GxxExxY protein [Pontiellaceae bacterium B12227]|nr:GxxExxY protein [Pontiellaceae bacterium B12227]